MLLGLCVFAAACGGGDKAKVQKVKDAMCACKDKACVDKVTADSKDVAEALTKKYASEKDVPADIKTLMDDIEKCEAKANEGEFGAKVTAMADAACACKDKACIEKVMSDMAALGKDAAATKPSDAMMKDAQRMAECAQKIMAAEAPPPPPPADPAAGSGSGSADPAAGSGSGSADPAAGSGSGSAAEPAPAH
ncbi:MAG: hypothetical protein K8W52_22330 [Deltaproteobacteria bacterium]|nr:hypothetical protein [Deltaproteobacteria bacterium]